MIDAALELSASLCDLAAVEIIVAEAGAVSPIFR
jgi:fructose-1,6-bisphosphatase/inositol monophosphatase family enzyme